MAMVTFSDVNKNEKQVTIHEGHTILRAARQGHVALRYKCGGNASCTTCKVIISEQVGISKPNQKEINRLGEADIEKGVRLSCQTAVYGTVAVDIPEDPFKARVRALLEEQRKGL